MKIVEYNDVDPLKVLYTNQLALGFSLTPELAVQIRQSDPRPFPCLAIYAVEDGEVLAGSGSYAYARGGPAFLHPWHKPVSHGL